MAKRKEEAFETATCGSFKHNNVDKKLKNLKNSLITQQWPKHIGMWGHTVQALYTLLSLTSEMSL